MQHKLTLIVAAWAAMVYALQPRHPMITAAAKLNLAVVEAGLKKRQVGSAIDICVYPNPRDVQIYGIPTALYCRASLGYYCTTSSGYIGCVASTNLNVKTTCLGYYEASSICTSNGGVCPSKTVQCMSTQSPYCMAFTVGTTATGYVCVSSSPSIPVTIGASPNTAFSMVTSSISSSSSSSTSGSSTSSFSTSSSPTSSSLTSSSPTPVPTVQTGLSVGSKVGIGIAVPVAIVALLAGLVFFIFERRKSRKEVERLQLQVQDIQRHNIVTTPGPGGPVSSPTSMSPPPTFYPTEKQTVSGPFEQQMVYSGSQGVHGMSNYGNQGQLASVPRGELPQ